MAAMMSRRQLLKTLGIGAAAVVCAPVEMFAAPQTVACWMPTTDDLYWHPEGWVSTADVYHLRFRIRDGVKRVFVNGIEVAPEGMPWTIWSEEADLTCEARVTGDVQKARMRQVLADARGESQGKPQSETAPKV